MVAMVTVCDSPRVMTSEAAGWHMTIMEVKNYTGTWQVGQCISLRCVIL